MTKFCGKCGHKIDENTNECPNCESVNKHFKNPNETLLKKHSKKGTYKRFKKNITKIILLVLILAVGVINSLVYFNIVDIPLIDEIFSKFQVDNTTNDINKTIADTDTNGFTYHDFSEDDISQQGNNGISYINNELLITLDSAKNKPILENHLRLIEGKIVGEIPELADYQVLLNKKYSLDELDRLLLDIQDLDIVITASVNYVLTTKPSYIPNDKKWKNKWDDFPSGSNWGIEAIEGNKAWDNKDKMQSVNIGIIDDMFDLYHEDLQFAEKPLGMAITNYDLNTKTNWSNHGTHTAGTIAASFDNQKGISGIAIKNNLYGVSFSGIESTGRIPLQSWKIAFYYLICTKKCSVINVSMGYDHLTFEASRKSDYATKFLEHFSNALGDFLGELIDKNYQFVICKAAGNQNEVNNEHYSYFKKDKDDTESFFDYYSFEDFQKYLNGEKGYDFFSRYENRKNEIQKQLESGNVPANYDFIGAISDKKVKDRIIVVGAITNLGTHKEGGFFGFGGTTVHDGYEISKYSQCGDRVDVVAPGTDIESTVKNGYDTMTGTSMASPHVAGTAGLIFSINPKFTGEQVVSIIKNSTSGKFGKESYGLINANNAVELALTYNSNSDNIATNGSINKDDIPNNAVEFNGHYYYIYDSTDVTNFDEANSFCQNRNGYLATITTKEENDFLYSYINKVGYTSAYFGLTDQDVEGVWKWKNGETVDYTNWHNNEPNSENDGENFAMFYSKYTDGTWNDGDFGNKTINSGTAFICEWGDYEASNMPINNSVESNLNDRNIVLVLDNSTSMSGTPLSETKKASINFINTILQENTNIGIVTYNDHASIKKNLSSEPNSLNDILSSMTANGTTNIEDGLIKARSMLINSNAKKKIIVLMSDGEPNKGLKDEELIQYANSIKNENIVIYTLGFFESLNESKSSAQYLMEKISSDGYHYEVSDADDLVFFFSDIADQIKGQKYIYIRIACPVDVSLSLNGETLSSNAKNESTRTSFGTLSYEYQDNEDKIKVLRLKDDFEYDINIVGTGRGFMQYTVGFMDDNGVYVDFRRFQDIPITRKTIISTIASLENDTILKLDKDGDGKVDIKYIAGENEIGKPVKHNYHIYIYVIIGTILATIIIVLIKSKNRKTEKRGK